MESRNADQSKKRFFSKRIAVYFFVMLGIAIVLAAGAATVLLYPMYTESLIMIKYTSEKPMWLKSVKVSEDSIWKYKNAHVLKTISKPGEGYSFSTFFTAAKDVVPIEITVENQARNPNTFLCMLDNRDRPCLFEVHFDGNELTCFPCQNMRD